MDEKQRDAFRYWVCVWISCAFRYMRLDISYALADAFMNMRWKDACAWVFCAFGGCVRVCYAFGGCVGDI